MFTEQVGQLDKLIGIAPEPLIDVLRSILGNCQQTIEHRGPIIYEGPVTFTGGAGTYQYAKASSNWVNVGGASNYVSCVKCDRTGVPTGGTVIVYLPETQSQHPNVRTGDIVAYMLDTDGTAICASDYLDDRIGTIKAWDNPSTIPGGWTQIAAGRTIFGYVAADPDFGSLAGTGGATQHTHSDHNASSISDHSGAATGNPSSTTVTLSGSTDSATSTGSTGSASGSISGSGTAASGNQSANPSLTSASGYAISEEVEVDDPGHEHEFTTDTNTFGGGGSLTDASNLNASTTTMTFQGQHTGDAPSTNTFRVAVARTELTSGLSLTGNHTHTVSGSDVAALLSGGSHTHTVTMSSHSHAFSGSATISNHTHTIPTLSHSGTLTHDTQPHLPPYYVAVWIKRTS